MRARGAPDRTAPSPARGDHSQHSHPQRPAPCPAAATTPPHALAHMPAALAPQPAYHPAPRRRRADTRTDA
eukprot:5912072-Prymnesium_polylepis.1